MSLRLNCILMFQIYFDCVQLLWVVKGVGIKIEPKLLQHSQHHIAMGTADIIKLIVVVDIIVVIIIIIIIIVIIISSITVINLSVRSQMTWAITLLVSLMASRNPAVFFLSYRGLIRLVLVSAVVVHAMHRALKSFCMIVVSSVVVRVVSVWIPFSSFKSLLFWNCTTYFIRSWIIIIIIRRLCRHHLYFRD